MKEHHPLTAAIAFLFLCASITIHAQEMGAAARRRRPPSAPAPAVNSEGRKAAEIALTRLQVLRDGWNDVNPQYILPNVTAGRELDRREYEVQYLEAKTAVDEALRLLPKGELRTAIMEAMDLFDDLEEVGAIFSEKSPFTTSVRVAYVYPYLKKYHVPYEGGVIRAGYGLMLHQDFVMSHILPIRYARVNRVEVLLGGSPQPTPPPPTFEQMYRVKTRKPGPVTTRSAVNEEVLKDVAGQALDARRQGHREWMGKLLDDGFVGYGPGGRRWDKRQYLGEMEPDSSVKRLQIERAVLSTRDGVPVLTTTVKYESFTGEFRNFVNIFTFVNRDGRWLIAAWRGY